MMLLHLVVFPISESGGIRLESIGPAYVYSVNALKTHLSVSSQVTHATMHIHMSAVTK